jgi:hypothetical protein
MRISALHATVVMSCLWMGSVLAKKSCICATGVPETTQLMILSSVLFDTGTVQFGAQCGR